MSKFAFVVVAILSVSTVSAVAEEKMIVDMRKLSCAELTKLGFEDFAGLTMWLSGYYNSSIRNTVVDLVEFAGAAKKVKELLPSQPARNRHVDERASARNKDAAVRGGRAAGAGRQFVQKGKPSVGYCRYYCRCHTFSFCQLPEGRRCGLEKP